MRWLGALAVILVGAAIYLYVVISDGSATPRQRVTSSEPAPVASDVEAAVSPDPPAATPARPRFTAKPATPPIAHHDSKPTVATAPSAPAPIEEPEAKRGPAELGDPDVPWTEPERQQWLWTANGRYEKGNFPRAVEAALEIARRNPNSAWEQDAWSVAIKSYCGMGETEKANALFAKMTDPTGIDEAVKRCGEWNVKLAKSP